ncbi:hypothetical protein K2173_028256 [Erythroxylum novogranatense]|uniref:Uncharacterized protein n=1 Tax=Erythroxylum novogranatense TaxID=1862640 RepID=A0AAV8U4C4_9ROSI|nr:hypothetical protein K2173_028256 [Erythroxylum novogranatense]
MKNKATGLLKQVMSALTSTVRTKTLALKGKTNAFRTGLIIFSLLRNKILMPTSISQKLHALIGHHPKQSEQGQANEEVVDQSKSPYNHRNMSVPTNLRRAQYMKNINEDNDKDSNSFIAMAKKTTMTKKKKKNKNIQT